MENKPVQQLAPQPIAGAGAKPGVKPIAKPDTKPGLKPGANPNLKRRPRRRHGPSPWIFVVLAIACGAISLYGLRENNLRMVELRAAVYTADEKGEDIEKPLRALREHVYGHMNTNLANGPHAVRPPIQLKFTYERLAKVQETQQKSRLDEASKRNATIYSEAQAYCEKTIPGGASGRFRLDCIENFIKQRPSDIQSVVSPIKTSIPKNLYQFDFISPRWSPDLAGFGLLAMALSLLAAVVSSLYRISLHLRGKW